MAKSDLLKETINVPVSRTFKRRLLALAEAFPGAPKPTVYARLLLEEGVRRAENGDHPGEVEEAMETAAK
jgi:hypothetical protein